MGCGNSTDNKKSGDALDSSKPTHAVSNKPGGISSPAAQPPTSKEPSNASPDDVQLMKEDSDSLLKNTPHTSPRGESPSAEKKKEEDHPPHLKAKAAEKIKKIAMRAKALKMAQAETQWKMFADLDTQDEAEMLHLAVFMQTLIDNIPDDDKEDMDAVKAHQLAEEGDEVQVKIENVKMAEKLEKAQSFKLDPTDYEIGDASITEDVIVDIMNCYRRRGRLSRKSIVKVLRRVYKVFQKRPNVTRISCPEGCKVTVVGDLHGQLSDLLHILDEAGLPSPNNKFVFNGDFVDRGQSGLEVVVLLFALFIAYGPEVISLNRGNHEDLPVCRVYGFEGEVKQKYDDLLFEMFAEVFTYIPLFALVNDAVFVVHGGLFHTPIVKLAELEEIQRNDYYVKPPIPYPQIASGLNAEDARKEFMKQLQRDALWSDPTIEEGCYLNPRGAGVSFGPDIAAVFMNYNELSMVIRSHEMVFKGFDLPYASNERTNMGIGVDDLTNPDNCPLLVTLFSASNYTDADNEGAYLTIMPHYFQDSVPAGKESGLFYNVYRYKTSNSQIALEKSNKLSLAELILKKRTALLSAFEAADPQNLGIVSRSEWADIMQRITLIKIRWLSIITKIAPAECLSPTSVAYKLFMQHFSLARRISSMQDMFEADNNAEETTDKLSIDTAGANAKAANSGSTKGTGSPKNKPSEQQTNILDDMYGQRKKLESIFFFFDTNGDGLISLEEFRVGCEKLNKTLHPDCQLTDIDRTLKMIDFDGSGEIDINEFFETFRILDAKDGQVDGVIGMATGRTSSVREMVRPASAKFKV